MYEFGITRSKYTLFPLGYSVPVDTRCPVCVGPPAIKRGTRTTYKPGHIKNGRLRDFSQLSRLALQEYFARY